MCSSGCWKFLHLPIVYLKAGICNIVIESICPKSESSWVLFLFLSLYLAELESVVKSIDSEIVLMQRGISGSHSFASSSGGEFQLLTCFVSFLTFHVDHRLAWKLTMSLEATCFVFNIFSSHQGNLTGYSSYNVFVPSSNHIQSSSVNYVFASVSSIFAFPLHWCGSSKLLKLVSWE